MSMAEHDDLRPWDCQPGESPKAYAAFVTYRDMGTDRTLRAVGQELDKSHQVLSRWSSQHHWVSRVAAWDSMPGRAVSDAYQEMAREIAEQHRELSNKLMARLSANLDLLPQGADPSIKWSTAHGAARQGHALATDLTKPESTKTDEISKAIENLIAKLAGE